MMSEQKMTVVKDHAGKNDMAVVEGAVNAKIYCLNTVLGVVEETVVKDKEEISMIAGLTDREKGQYDGKVGFTLDAQLWDAPPAAGEQPKEVEFVNVVATKSSNHGFDLCGVVIQTPDGRVFVYFGTVLLMNMNPMTGDLKDTEITIEQVEKAITFFQLESAAEVVEMFKQHEI